MKISKKKNTQSDGRRNVRRQQRANVFSYYSSQSSRPSERVNHKDLPIKSRIPIVPNQIRVNILKKNLISVLSIVAILICIIYATTLSSDVLIKQPSNNQQGHIVYDTQIYAKGIQSVLDKSISSKSKLFINVSDVESQIKKKYPELSDVSISLPILGRRLTVVISVSQPRIVIKGGLQDYLINENGRIISNLSDAQSSVTDKLPILTDRNMPELKNGQYALSREIVLFITEINHQLKSKNISISSIELVSDSMNELILKTTDVSYFVKFDSKGNSRIQSGTFIATRKQLQADGKEPAEYMDVRVPGKVYYR